jgi:pyruvate dehydrogenase E2 component (dihydrolipoamide acetyltransferase)
MEKVENIELKIPNLGEAESTQIIEINIKSGSEVNENDPLIVLESEKAAMEIPSDFDGEVLEVYVKEGQEVSEGQPFAKIKAFKKITDQKSENLPSDKDIDTKEQKPEQEDVISVDFSGVNAGPAVRKYARELEINLKLIVGTGRNNRITKDDLKNFIHSKTTDQPKFPTEKDFTRFGKFEIKKLSKIRAVGSKNMSSSWSTIPHVTHFEEAEMTNLNVRRSELQVSPLSFFVKIVSTALVEHKIFNSSLLKNNEILIKDFINIGIAVDTPDGLVVPVVKDVLKKDVMEISDEISELASKAKNKKLLVKDLEGATFTISSLGKIGGTGFTPIINPPEVAILAISRTNKVLKFVNSEIKEVEVVPFSLSYDHRVINGADAGNFMSDLRYKIENYSQ